MLLDIFQSLIGGEGSLIDILVQSFFVIVIVLIALSSHELAHGYIAYKLGDPTAKNMGRLTLEPTKHLDPIGTISMLLFGFGWAKPVPVNSRYFKKPKRDMALTALAGPAINLIIAFAAALLLSVIAAIVNLIGVESQFAYNVAMLVLTFFSYMHTMNLYLSIFNLIPVPPLDGSRLLFIFLPDKYYFGLMKYERYISLAIMLLLYTGALSSPLSYVCNLVSNGMFSLISFIPGL